MFRLPSGMYFSACLGSLFVSILCTCCSHFFWYCFISFNTRMFCAPVLSLIHWFFFYPILLFLVNVSKISSVPLLNVVPLFSSVPMLHKFLIYKWEQKMPETCRVQWQSKFWIFDASSWLFYTKLITMRCHLNIKYTITLFLAKSSPWNSLKWGALQPSNSSISSYVFNGTECFFIQDIIRGNSICEVLTTVFRNIQV